jgi:hypothetical protein
MPGARIAWSVTESGRGAGLLVVVDLGWVKAAMSVRLT